MSLQKKPWPSLLKWAGSALVLAALMWACSSCDQPPQDGVPYPTLAELVGDTLEHSPYPPTADLTRTAQSYPAPEAIGTAGGGLPFPDITEEGTVAAAPGCDVVERAPEFSAGSFDAAPESILSFLNAGGGFGDLEQALGDSGYGSVPLAVIVGDLTGNQVQEVIVSIFDPESELVFPPGLLLMYGCTGSDYQELYRAHSSPGSGPPHLWYLEDLDEDGDQELVVSEPTCGAHTCTERVQVLAWEDGEVVNILNGDTSDMPTPDIRLVEQKTTNTPMLEMASGGILSAGAGPQRTEIRRWMYDPVSRALDLEEAFYLPSVYRIHLLADAEGLVDVGDNESALKYYGRVANDENLEDWQNPAEERHLLGAFARYKIVMLHVMAGEDETAEA
ncbi:MAG: hypothetical protein R3335_15550, partial [Anaerolineales bacterium]|nr:hypothetical protein [Anaerolineales bacterium]